MLKLKKPVRFPFLDFSTLADREFQCREDVRLNARLAPTVYLGVRALRWHAGAFSLAAPEELPAPGLTVDWLVLMRRLPEQRMLHRMISEGRVTDADVDSLVALLGRFYRDALVLPVATAAYGLSQLRMRSRWSTVDRSAPAGRSVHPIGRAAVEQTHPPLHR
ncbi:hypothetical protein [Rhizobacter sp. Root404]|uniref:hypothetical protein n=1 Tax=Rhizobacter sp. Root404 TaxID=1736528 RepID=UPI0007006E07|nr:hypothetical protein [Rhizobacter sp. Root404]KQW37699.1 hypothetical protein ASC76_06225 [Rhizobacter sp. Root404]